MPQFTYSATDLAGNVVEGSLAANDMVVAADQVRRMGYTPVRVENTDAAPSARPLLLVETASVGQQETYAASMPAYAPLDLTQAYVEPQTAPNSVITLLAPMLDGSQTANVPALAGERRLEPWERSVGGEQSLEVPALNAAQEFIATAQTVPQATATNGATSTVAHTLPPQSQTQAHSRTGIVIPYGEGVVSDKSFWQRFLETMVYPIFSGVVLKDMAPFLRQFATLINAGLPLYQALAALEGNTKNPKLKEIASEGQRQVQAGGRFSDVMMAYPWIFQPMQVAMIRAAEQGGMLDTTLKQVADYIEHDMEIRRLISRETLYPKITLFMALMILGRTGFTSGLPAVSKLVLGGMGKETYTVMNYLADTLGFGLLMAVPAVAVAIVFRLFLFNVQGVREGYDAFKMKIPVIGKISQMFATAKFARTYAALYRGGFGAGLALSIAGDACGNGVLRRAALNAIPDAERGGLVSTSLARTNAFPGMAMDMFRTGETSGALDQMLDRMADYYEAEGKQRSHQGAMILGVVVFLIVAILVANSIIGQYSALGARETTLPPEGE